MKCYVCGRKLGDRFVMEDNNFFHFDCIKDKDQGEWVD